MERTCVVRARSASPSRTIKNPGGSSERTKRPVRESGGDAVLFIDACSHGRTAARLFRQRNSPRAVIHKCIEHCDFPYFQTYNIHSSRCDRSVIVYFDLLDTGRSMIARVSRRAILFARADCINEKSRRNARNVTGKMGEARVGGTKAVKRRAYACISPVARFARQNVARRWD